ncbi:hypothetical protein M427DRAFT_135168 [Gonapodya prolifera JEL478]|uniref:DUF3752 domain-containing protein n=1 Tax=Gonapodya prolifera (strain JEL478) TaxID=1344416 RepID=A0A139AFK4_GONPJ|nr:hypothetical protein M427DRAFT_135168 [Gonapodya prolifera JEL478]|eukprot:KXS15479.1 hypothetical protein M427DRAFT_135168 [Gonapodya prolifera JEL478]
MPSDEEQHPSHAGPVLDDDSDAYHGPSRPPPSPPSAVKGRRSSSNESDDSLERRRKRRHEGRSKDKKRDDRDRKKRDKKRRRSRSESRSDRDGSDSEEDRSRRRKHRKEKHRHGENRSERSKKHPDPSNEAEKANGRSTSVEAGSLSIKEPNASSAPPAPRIMGPAMPPPEMLREMALRSAPRGPEVDPLIGPDFGPPGGPPTADEEQAELEEKIRELERRARGAAERSDEEGKAQGEKEERLKRGDWMLIPPEPKRLGVNLAPNLFKNRGFSQTGVAGVVDQSGWTETPEEKEKRFREEAAGKSSAKKKTPSSNQPEYTPRDMEHFALASSLNSKRGPSLLDSHVAQRAASGAKSDLPQGWDRERDLTARRVDPKLKAEMLEKSKELGGRFGHGSSGGAFL